MKRRAEHFRPPFLFRRKGLLNAFARSYPGTETHRRGRAIVTETSDHQPPNTSSRRAQRLERQARVGILRNPNHPPRPPLRRAALMGKWPRLRSNRRPPAAAPTVWISEMRAPDRPTSRPVGDDCPPTPQGRATASDTDLAFLIDSARDTGKNSVTRADHAENPQIDPDNAPTDPKSTPALSRGHGVIAPVGHGATLRALPQNDRAQDQPRRQTPGWMPAGLVLLAGFGFLGIAALLFDGR